MEMRSKESKPLGRFGVFGLRKAVSEVKEGVDLLLDVPTHCPLLGLVVI